MKCPRSTRLTLDPRESCRRTTLVGLMFLAWGAHAQDRPTSQPKREFNPKLNPGKGTTKDIEREKARLSQESRSPNRPAGSDEAYRKALERIEKILGEKSDSSLPDCHVSLRFDGLHLTSKDGKIKFPARSGKLVKGSFDYSVARQGVVGAGPIPEGGYWIDPCEVEDAWSTLRHTTLSEKSRAAWGRKSVTIHPFSTTHGFGRYGFFIHGGDTWGSAGCIDLRHKELAFFRELDHERLCEEKCKIYLEVRYVVSKASPPIGWKKKAFAKRVEAQLEVEETLWELVWTWLFE